MAKSNNATSGNFFDGGNGRNVGLTNDLYDLQKFAKQGEVGLMQQSGAMTEAEAEQALKEFDKQNEAERGAAVKDVERQSGLNTVMNVAGLGLSVVSGSAALKAAKAAGKAGTIASAGSKLGKVEAVVKGKVTELGSKLAHSGIGQKLGNTIKTIGNTKVGSILKSGAQKIKSGFDKIDDGIKNATKSNLAFKDITKTIDGKEAIVQKASAIGTLKTAFKGAGASLKSSKGVFSAIGNVGKAATQITIGSAEALGALAGKCFAGMGPAAAGASKLGRFIHNTGNILKLSTGTALVTAPILTTQMITRNISDEKTEKLNGAIAVLNDMCEYYETRGDKLTEQQKKDYDELLKYRDESHAALIDKYEPYIDENGDISDPAAKQAFYEDYKKVEQECAGKLDEQSKSWQDFAKASVSEGVSMKMAGSMTEHSVDVDDTLDASSYIDQKMQENPEALDKAYAGERINQELADHGEKDGFWGFIQNIHATILHYVPVVAYAEAFVKKGVDAALTVLPIGYEEKYAGQSISDLAHSISDDADAVYELNQQKKEIVSGCEAGSDIGFDDKQETQDEKSSEDTGGNYDDEAYALA